MTNYSDVSVIRNGEAYLDYLVSLLMTDARIEHPKARIGKIHRDKNNRLIGWEFEEEKIHFFSGNYIQCLEEALIEGDRYQICFHSYHFSPSTLDSNLKMFRIDLHRSRTAGNKTKLHLNADKALCPPYTHWIDPSQLTLKIKDFNTLLAIYLSFEYEKTEIYPADHRANSYNLVLDNRREAYA
jgi:hypothetical protein